MRSSRKSRICLHHWYVANCMYSLPVFWIWWRHKIYIWAIKSLLPRQVWLIFHRMYCGGISRYHWHLYLTTNVFNSKICLIKFNKVMITCTFSSTCSSKLMLHMRYLMIYWWIIGKILDIKIINICRCHKWIFIVYILKKK